MYISLGLLWLCFKIIQGEIIQCPLGGISNSAICEKLTKDLVFRRFYLGGFQTKINGNKDNKYDVYDVTYERSKEVSKNEAIESELNVFNPLDIMRLSMNAYITMYTKIIFRQSLIENCDQIKNLWDKTLLEGTDTYRLKLHNKLISTYKGTEKELSSENCFVLIETYYDAASIYFFSMMYTTALYKIEDGIRFGISVRNEHFKDDKISKGSKILNLWLRLCESLKQEILMKKDEIERKKKGIHEASTPDETLEQIKAGEVIHKASTPDETLKQLTTDGYCSVSVLFYRKYFLDDNQRHPKRESLTQWATDHFNRITDNAIIYTKYNSMYNFLLLGSVGKTDQVKLKNIINAISLPVLSTEGRLLNYKALLITMDMIHICLDEYGLLKNLSKNSSCQAMNLLEKENSLFRDTIIPKLKNVYCAMHKKDIITKLIENLSTEKAAINERLLHVIVTSAIDFDDNNYKKHIKTIKSAIEVLEYFVNVLTVEKEEKVNNYAQTDNKSDYESEEDFTTIEPAKINYTEEMNKAFSHLTYSTTNKTSEKVFIAYKWLAELYGALCEETKNLTKYQKRLNIYIGLAENVKINDDHLKYLRNKQEVKIILANNSWEVNNWRSGWYFSNLKPEKSKILNTPEMKKYFFKVFEELNKSECPYINKIEINILLYRLYVMDPVKNYNEKMYQYLKSAINEIVITSEDRTRNLEAHELLSMHLMIVNRLSIEKHTVNTMPSDETSVNTMPSDETNTESQPGWIPTTLLSYFWP